MSIVVGVVAVCIVALVPTLIYLSLIKHQRFSGPIFGVGLALFAFVGTTMYFDISFPYQTLGYVPIILGFIFCIAGAIGIIASGITGGGQTTDDSLDKNRKT